VRVVMTAVAITLGFNAALVVTAQTAKPAAPKPAAPRPAGAPPSSIRVVATTKQLMHIATIPASDVIFKAAGDPPKTDEAWAEVRDRGLAVAESGNLLMIGSRIVDRTTWMQYSRAMVDAAANVAKAADAKNGDALSMASDALYDTCETCHAKYLKK
jgi:cytochrome c'